MINNLLMSQGGSKKTQTIDGKYVVVGLQGGNALKVSNDYGSNWTNNTSRNYYSTAVSSTGQYMLAVVNNGQVYMSSDYGVTWTGNGVTDAWYGCSISANGQYQFACASGATYILKSSDYGANWSRCYGGYEDNYTSVKCSNSGQYVTASTYQSFLYRSTDYGENWSIVNNGTVDNYYWVAMSADGSRQSVITLSGGAGYYMSTNYGASWSVASSYTGWKSDMSLDGKYHLICDGNTTAYKSSDYGATFSACYSGSYVRGAGVSATGKYMLIVTAYSILISSDYGVNWTQTASVAGGYSGAINKFI